MNNRLLSLSVVVLLAGLAGFGATGCTIHTSTPSVIVEPLAPPPPMAVVVNSPPARVYHNGHWLHYRTDGYYYYYGGAWVVASTVPTRVASYHRPAHVRRVTHVRRAPQHQTRVVHHSTRRAQY